MKDYSQPPPPSSSSSFRHRAATSTITTTIQNNNNPGTNTNHTSRSINNNNSSQSPTTTTTTTTNSITNTTNNEELTRVWVRQSVIDAVVGTNTNSIIRKKQSSLRGTNTATTTSLQQQQLLSTSTSTSSSSTLTQLTSDLTLGDGSSLDTTSSSTVSGGGLPPSTGNGGSNNNHSGTTTFAGRVMQWGWKEGILVSSSSSSLDHTTLTIQLGNHNNHGKTTATATTTTIQLPRSELEQGNVVLANDERIDPTTGEVIMAAPHDLIALTHLHEPAVCMALQQRYHHDLIYTNTGPVLLAINPFCVIAGLYGESVQRKYVDAAEKKLFLSTSTTNSSSSTGTTINTPLPPHVYAIADTAFRSMMRSMEDQLSSSSDNTVAIITNNNNNRNTTPQQLRTSLDTGMKNNTDSGTTNMSGKSGTQPTIVSSSSTTGGGGSSGSRPCVNQSILISGESGSGKTVTTKFVMKYLAALSQRSVQIQESGKERAYLKVGSAHQLPPEDGSTTGSISSIVSKSANGVTWRKSGSAANGGSVAAVDTTIAEAVVAAVTSSTIEAQVLQSNPILESFGNARTVRNDNSSRFGKFIEIQFTISGKLVGAVLQTYLLEKVRLNYQNDGERNYHIFYELLSGNMSPRELSQYFLAHTANPDDFKLTNSSGTMTRRDGVSDRETCSGLLVAFETMKFTKSDVQDVFGITAAILHASNLTFIDLNNDTCCLDENNVHFYPVCTLLGLSVADVNQAICHCQLTAGDVNVTRSLSVAQAIIGLESLLKETYGALFQYLVKRINGQMAMVDNERMTAAATIGVLDIFGFESFAVNSFEQLCINYCNEALQQQFNAFVLQNEQAEYEREGIQWSFIEFPENQDVLDLMEKRGSSVLSILDDQCKAPGPSDKAFCLAVYSQCSNKPRFSATRKQQALLQFSIHHYAGPVEYTVAGFTAKNKDEPPKETILLLRSSSNPLVQMLATLMEEALETATPGEVDSSGEFKTTPTPKRLHRADSAMARPTVGGQFRSQLRILRQKIDRTAPHYIRCLKPNDMLVPDHFDIAIVAEQLKCGGILEAVRVARAGFTQHYSHADFCRRYRALAWKEMSASTTTYNTSTIRAPTPPKWSIPTSSPKAKSNRHSFPVSTFVPKSLASSSNKQQLQNQVMELTPADAKTMCKDLLKVLFRKIERHGGATVENVGAVASSSAETFDTPSPVARAKTYSFKSPSTTAPSWTAKTASPASPTMTATTTPNKPPTPTASGWKPRGSSSLITGADLAKVGIQMGKTKVFLRHKAFEVLERIRGTEQAMAATKLNSIFRRYLARIAYIPYRDAMRQARERQRQIKLASLGNNTSGMEFDEFKEMKEQDYDDYSSTAHDGSCKTRRNFQSARSTFYSNDSQYNAIASDKWTELQIKEAIHNPVPRHEWGKQAPLDAEKFKWVIREGLWVKNYA